MTMLLLNPLRRWWQANFVPVAPVAVPALVIRRRAVCASGASRSRPLTPFVARPRAGAAVDDARCAARRFWMTLDPHDQRHAAIGGSFAQVCAALERLAALEEGHTG
jgi:hypothetical protein